MDFSFSTLFKYWDVLTQYVNPLNILLWGIIGGLVALIIVIILQIILRKKILVNRRHWSLKILAYCYMVFFPVWVGLNSAQWFALHSFERQVVQNMPVYLGEANAVFNKYLKAEVEKIITQKQLELTGHQVIDKSVSYVSDMTGGFSETISKTQFTKESVVAAFIVQALAKTGILKDIVVDYIEKSIGKALLMDKELTKEFMNVTFQNMIDDGVINTILIKYTKHILGGFKMNILLMLLLVMAFPIAEILIAHWLEKRKLASTIVTSEENKTINPELIDESEISRQ